MRRALIILSLTIAWAAFALVLKVASDLQSAHCRRFGDLVAECMSPFQVFLAGAALAFLLATTALALLAWRGRGLPGGEA